eukprot:GEMP01085049.1.p1 GENE.GEMP01085049.1~~GEMP01085049.1.p1  ORF type:complete len:106 (-),score=3.74 GEMP01085049.1:165-482(-)
MGIFCSLPFSRRFNLPLSQLFDVVLLGVLDSRQTTALLRFFNNRQNAVSIHTYRLFYFFVKPKRRFRITNHQNRHSRPKSQTRVEMFENGGCNRDRSTSPHSVRS